MSAESPKTAVLFQTHVSFLYYTIVTGGAAAVGFIASSQEALTVVVSAVLVASQLYETRTPMPCVFAEIRFPYQTVCYGNGAGVELHRRGEIPTEEGHTCASRPSSRLRSIAVFPFFVLVPVPSQGGRVHSCEVVVSVDSAAVECGEKQPFLHDLFSETVGKPQQTRQLREGAGGMNEHAQARLLQRRSVCTLPRLGDCGD